MWLFHLPIWKHGHFNTVYPCFEISQLRVKYLWRYLALLWTYGGSQRLCSVEYLDLLIYYKYDGNSLNRRALHVLLGSGSSARGGQTKPIGSKQFFDRKTECRACLFIFYNTARCFRVIESTTTSFSA